MWHTLCMNPTRKVKPDEKALRTSLLTDLKEKLGGWRKDATAAQVGKIRMAGGGKVPERRGEPEGKMSHPVLFAKGGTVEEGDDVPDEGKAGPGTRGIGEPTEEDRAEFEGDAGVDNDFPGSSDDDESDIAVEKDVQAASKAEGNESEGEDFEAMMKRLLRG